MSIITEQQIEIWINKTTVGEYQKIGKNDPTQSKKNYKSNMVIRKGHIVNNNDTNIVLRGNCARNCSSYMTQITDIDLLHCSSYMTQTTDRSITL